MTVYCNDPARFRASEVIVNGVSLGEFSAPVEVEKIDLGAISVSWDSYPAYYNGSGINVPYSELVLVQGTSRRRIWGDTDITVYASPPPGVTVIFPTNDIDPISIIIAAGNGHQSGVGWNIPRPQKTFTVNDKRWKIRISEVSP